MRCAWLLPLAALVVSCGANSSSEQKPAASAEPQTEVRIAHRPPTAKDIIAAVIASGNLALSVSPTCHNVGTEPTDATIGRYLAGFMAELSSPDKKNWIETAVESGTSAAGEAVSICKLTLRHLDGDDRWGWGVEFQVRNSDGLVLANSFTCTGAG